jgi:hypothetical protein
MAGPHNWNVDFGFQIPQFVFRIPQFAIGMDQKIALWEQWPSNLQTRITDTVTSSRYLEAEVYRGRLRETNLTDRALKLAEVRKPESNWELSRVLGLPAFVLGFLAGK